MKYGETMATARVLSRFMLKKEWRILLKAIEILF